MTEREFALESPSPPFLIPFASGMSEVAVEGEARYTKCGDAVKLQKD